MSRSVVIPFGLSLLLACGSGTPTGTATKTTYVYQGVFGGDNGTEAGNFSVSVVVEDSTGSGTFTVNGSSHAFTTMIYTGTSFTASGSGFAFTGTVDDSSVVGSYESGSGGGLFSGLRKTSTVVPSTFCGTHIGRNDGVPLAGTYAFVQGGPYRHGVFTSVLGDAFHGYLRAVNGATPVTLDTLAGAASLTVSGATFLGSYAMANGDTGLVAGNSCPLTVPGTISSAYDGVLGSFDGTELGTMTFLLSSSGLGSTGSYRIGTTTRQFVSVISGVNNEVAAFDSAYRVIVSLDSADLSGLYSRHDTLNGRVAAMQRDTLSTVAYCGKNSRGTGAVGAFAFLLRSDSVLFGTYTGGSLGDAFQGEISGRSGDNNSALETDAGPVSILPSGQSFAGVWDHSGTGGSSGTLTGAVCP
ncbi:MAG TPA: hypothetical protein VMG41_02535 [Gemmatimonadales bacterium]|nr:hypothetical protein [Gemmatimonadales bacterium]